MTTTDERLEALEKRIEYLESQMNEGRRAHNGLNVKVGGWDLEIMKIDPNSWYNNLKKYPKAKEKT